MTQVIARVPDDVVAALDALVDTGRFETRSDAVREAISQLVERHRRAEIGHRIVEGYTLTPQSADDLRSVELIARAMIDDEPW